MTLTTETINHVEITTDGKTVWINSDICIGRFSARGIDVYKPLLNQIRDASQCLDCNHHLPFDEAWKHFQASMLKYHGFFVADKFKPSKR